MIADLIAKELCIPEAKFEHIRGGDINSSYKITMGSAKFFLKINTAEDFPEMFVREAEGLKALQEHSAFKVPAVIKSGTTALYQYLLLEWLEKSSTGDDQHNAGVKLASMHRQSKEWFGWHNNNYIGSLSQLNTRHAEWFSFYTDCRILPMIRILFEQHKINKREISHAEKFCSRVKVLFPEEKGSFLHGDLWSGNFMNAEGGPAVFDPAIYYGHREMDIGMTKLFGGFNNDFYTGYHETYPLTAGWQTRLEYAQLYPLLVHAVLFGGNYVETAMKIIKRF